VDARRQTFISFDKIINGLKKPSENNFDQDKMN
jgi:hypothetical protein